MRKLGVTLVIGLLLAAAVATEWQMNHIPREDPLGRELLFLPTYRAMKLASLGNEALAADILYMWAIQYYGVFIPNERFLYINSMFDLITDLDPHYFEAYTLGGMLMAMAGARDPDSHKDAVIALYDKGLAAMPEDFRLGEIAAWDFHTMWKDDAVATRFLEKIMDRPGVPHRIARVLGRWRDGSQLWTWDESITYWQQALRETVDQRDHDYAVSHLYDSVSARDRAVLDPILATRHALDGECPVDFSVFVNEGVFRTIPVDLANKPYGIDPSTCATIAFKDIRGM